MIQDLASLKAAAEAILRDFKENDSGQAANEQSMPCG
jgi:hypothetical protein